MKPFSWAANIMKLQRALGLSKTKENDEVKEIYLRIGGLITPGTEIAGDGTPSVQEETVPESVEKVAPKTVKKARKIAKKVSKKSK